MNKLVVKVTYIIHKYTKYLKNQSFTLHYLQNTTLILVHVLPKIFLFIIHLHVHVSMRMKLYQPRYFPICSVIIYL